MKHLTGFILVSLFILGHMGVIAQDDTNPSDACDYDYVVGEQSRLAALLEDFDQLIQEDPQEALRLLQLVADGYDALAVSCEQPTITFDITSIGDPENGRMIFEMYYVDVADSLQFTCTSCHNLQPSESPIAPSFEDIVARVIERLETMTPLETYLLTSTTQDAPIEDQIVGYLYTAIVNPATFSEEGYHAYIMPDDWGQVLTRQEVLDLVAYLVTLGE